MPGATPACRRGAFAAAAAGLLATSGAGAADLHVPSQYPTIQAAINAAQHADTIIVADGLYRGPGNINLSFGGKRITVRSQNGPDFTTIDAQRNGSIFIFSADETPESIVEGFTIRGASQSGIRILGGRSGRPSPTIRDCTIMDNWNGGLGGGAVFIEGASAQLHDCILDINLASQGGGILLWDGAHASLVRCTISGNRVDITGGGGAMADLGSTLIMESCIIRDNQAIGFIGSSAGVRIARESTGLFVNCLLHGNTATNTGAAISITNDGAGEIINCTVALNQAQSGAGMLLTDASAGIVNVSVANTIFWGNIPDQIQHSGGNLDVSYSIVQSGWPGIGNSAEDPIFVDPFAGNFEPSANAAFDAGDNTALPLHILTDLAGNPRFVNAPLVPGTGVPGGAGGSAIVDLGAYERQAGCYPNCDGSTTPPILNVDDFTCFINEFAAAAQLPHQQQVTHYVNCDQSTTAPALNVDDFTCFINAFAAGCP